MVKQKKYDPETGDEIDDDDPELEEGEEKSFDGYIVDKSIFPSSVVHLEQKDQFLV